MTAALAHSLPTAFRFARARARARLEHVALVLGVCLPVPLLAVTGLSIPLPSSVERLAAALVPWAETSSLDTGGARGSIIRTGTEGGSQRKSGSRSSLDVRDSARATPGDNPAARAPGSPTEGTRTGVAPGDKTAPADTTTPDSGENRGETSSGAADSPVQAPVEQPGARQETPLPVQPPPPPPPGVAPPPPPPITGIVDDATNTVRDTTRPIADDVGKTVDGVTEPVIGVKPGEAVKGAIPIGTK